MYLNIELMLNQLNKQINQLINRKYISSVFIFCFGYSIYNNIEVFIISLDQILERVVCNTYSKQQMNFNEQLAQIHYFISNFYYSFNNFSYLLSSCCGYISINTSFLKFFCAFFALFFSIFSEILHNQGSSRNQYKEPEPSYKVSSILLTFENSQEIPINYLTLFNLAGDNIRAFQGLNLTFIKAILHAFISNQSFTSNQRF
ncbi:transmembrane protein, putative (macronuclear) [Tetrahymena thermophila SB210]|uniref:Transmembrane protein, putative n=1 Tax=Tetrahymena thermophila (strain SB210) TaxID=312017 RepID=W7XAL7_TETTS|nr:transmembrane protein, putative [Tetrahymena thermophila SB210]EWS73458.1 transmembrane protein, putative [Tetrahymena thermophila SB210]|eukprot:XP_012654029.1 transmembrane protein, putative [Tetrahymena thermophila SB210]